MMLSKNIFVILAGCVSLTVGYPVRENFEDKSQGPNLLAEETPSAAMPYEFGYDVNDPVEGYTMSRQESGNGKGTVTGQYSIALPDGRYRTVRYIADEFGFRASVVTNERGTESKNPASVIMQSSAPTAAEEVESLEAAKAIAISATPSKSGYSPDIVRNPPYDVKAY